MHPRLVVLSGPTAGASFALGEADLVIGRQRSADLSIADLTVSRRHCLIRRDGDGYRVVDLDSRAGTYVNGAAVRERRLVAGDRILVGHSALVFRADALEEASSLGTATLDDASAPAEERAVTLNLEEARYLGGGGAAGEAEAAAGAGSARRARDLATLLRVGRAIGSIRDPAELEQLLLHVALEVVPAERSAVVLIGSGPDDVRSTCALVRGEPGAHHVRVSRTIAARVLGEGVALMTSQVAEEPELRGAASVSAAAVSAVLCVPLVAFGKPLGLVYADAASHQVRFDRDHLEVMTAIAAMAAVALDGARRVAWLEGETNRLRDEVDLEHDMVGDSPAMREVLRVIAKVAPRETTVLVLGESGTGKEPAARAIHRNSPRAQRSFVAINCAALPEALLESELFGHEKGAFTGATAQKKGRIELADGGTLFLDEIGELAPSLQAKLLRVLQERELERVGGVRTIKVDVRLIAATNRDLEAAARAGTFRQDLFYRLSVVSFRMPALRERPGDVPLLAAHFIRKHGQRLGRTVTGLAPEVRERLVRYDWPGNVRELENAIERALVLGSGDTLALDDLPEALLDLDVGAGAAPATTPAAMRFHDAVRETKRRLVVDAFREAGGSYKDTALLLGLHPNYLHRLIRSLELKAELERRPAIEERGARPGALKTAQE